MAVASGVVVFVSFDIRIELCACRKQSSNDLDKRQFVAVLIRGARVVSSAYLCDVISVASAFADEVSCALSLESQYAMYCSPSRGLRYVL